MKIIEDKNSYNIRKFIPDFCIENNLDVAEVTNMLVEYYGLLYNELNNPTSYRVKLDGLGFFFMSENKCNKMIENEERLIHASKRNKIKDVHRELKKKYEKALELTVERREKRTKFFRDKYENYEDFKELKKDIGGVKKYDYQDL